MRKERVSKLDFGMKKGKEREQFEYFAFITLDKRKQTLLQIYTIKVDKIDTERK